MCVWRNMGSGSAEFSFRASHSYLEKIEWTGSSDLHMESPIRYVPLRILFETLIVSSSKLRIIGVRSVWRVRRVSFISNINGDEGFKDVTVLLMHIEELKSCPAGNRRTAPPQLQTWELRCKSLTLTP